MEIVNIKNYIKKKGKNNMCMDIVQEIQERRKDGRTYRIEDMKEVSRMFLDSIKYDGQDSVPIIGIVRNCGFKVICGSMREKKMSGFVSVNENNKIEFKTDKVIGINGKDDLGHQRFVIAHEFAHFLFDYNFQSPEPYFDTYMKDAHESQREQIANMFAVNILMPAKEFVLKFDDEKNYEKKYRRLGRIFWSAKKKRH